MVRPAVFDEYEKEGAVDAAYNCRDNTPSFHTVMKTHRWKVRCLSFFLAIAGANAFSAYLSGANYLTIMVDPRYQFQFQHQ
ncbi:hypothetical protein VTP01DRAFT_3238 [Rhizomucor pusillus]|uniref:uncharacterized protein n=1 Tax=Rhizomucor pusillus TaxID=4840 RepID=UPI003744A08E